MQSIPHIYETLPSILITTHQCSHISIILLFYHVLKRNLLDYLTKPFPLLNYVCSSPRILYFERILLSANYNRYYFHFHHLSSVICMTMAPAFSSPFFIDKNSLYPKQCCFIKHPSSNDSRNFTQIFQDFFCHYSKDAHKEHQHNILYLFTHKSGHFPTSSFLSQRFLAPLHRVVEDTIHMYFFRKVILPDRFASVPLSY